MPKDSYDSDPIKIGDQEFYVSPASASDTRAHALLPSVASEDVSGLLGDLAIPPRQPASDEKKDYLPNEAIEWILDIRFDGDPRLDTKRMLKAFRHNWQEDYSTGTLYGFDPEQRRWTYADCRDAPEAVTRLKLGLDYFPAWKEESPATAQDFQRRETTARRHALSLGAGTVVPNVSAQEAADRALFLFNLMQDHSAFVNLTLQAPAGQFYDGRKLWDAMLCLGLRWGDMDLFHLENSGDEGHDQLFSVSTSTPPGYFLPEEIAANRLKVRDLQFGFSLPRCARPLEVFDAMQRAVGYCQKRLGGDIIDLAEVADYRKEIIEEADYLTKAGFAPGSSSALRLF